MNVDVAYCVNQSSVAADLVYIYIADPLWAPYELFRDGEPVLTPAVSRIGDQPEARVDVLLASLM